MFDLICWVLRVSTFGGYLKPNPFLCKSLQFKTIQFTMSTQFNSKKYFYFKLFKQLYITIQFSVSTDFVYTHLHVNSV